MPPLDFRSPSAPAHPHQDAVVEHLDGELLVHAQGAVGAGGRGGGHALDGTVWLRARRARTGDRSPSPPTTGSPSRPRSPAPPRRRRRAGDRGAVVLAHPHPLQGGSMTSLVVDELFRVLPAPGARRAALRLPGGGPLGRRARPRAGRAARRGRRRRGPGRGLPDAAPSCCAAGPSAPTSRSRRHRPLGRGVGRGIAPPLRVLPLDELAAAAGADPRPTRAGRAGARPVPAARRRPAPRPPAGRATRVEVITGADHFLVGRADRVAEVVVVVAASLGR